MHLVDHARAHIEGNLPAAVARPARCAVSRRRDALSAPAPHGDDGGRDSAKPFAPLLAALGLKPLAAACLGSHATVRRPPRPRPASDLANGARKARVALLAGCANERWRRRSRRRTIRLLNRHGVEVVVAAEAACCGSLEHHIGREGGRTRQARANIDAWTNREIERQAARRHPRHASRLRHHRQRLWLHAAHRSDVCGEGRRVQASRATSRNIWRRRTPPKTLQSHGGVSLCLPLQARLRVHQEPRASASRPAVLW